MHPSHSRFWITFHSIKFFNSQSAIHTSEFRSPSPVTLSHSVFHSFIHWDSTMAFSTSNTKLWNVSLSLLNWKLMRYSTSLFNKCRYSNLYLRRNRRVFFLLLLVVVRWIVYIQFILNGYWCFIKYFEIRQMWIRDIKVIEYVFKCELYQSVLFIIWKFSTIFCPSRFFLV